MSARRPSKAGIAAAAGADPLAVRAAAVALLARRDLSSHTLCERLMTQGFAASAAEAVVGELQRQGILDDERYAQNYVTYHAGRGQGPIRIAAELRRQGLREALIEGALEGGPDWTALACSVRARRFGGPPSSWNDRARQARFLQYRGFSSDHIRAATGAEPDLDPSL
jgi:regulatory protein